MVPALRVKDGVRFDTISPGGFVILAALWHASQILNHDLTITSGTDGAHSGGDDPHHSGRAYDVRTQGYDAQAILSTVMTELLESNTDRVILVANGYVTDFFFGWIEDAGKSNEHAHFQVRRGSIYPPGDKVITA